MHVAAASESWHAAPDTDWLAFLLTAVESQRSPHCLNKWPATFQALGSSIRFFVIDKNKFDMT
jgi:hypothetical protein